MKTFNKPEGMQVPEGYFEKNKAALLSIPRTNSRKPLLIPLYRYVLYGIATAAVLSALYFNLPKTQENTSFEKLDQDILVEYLMLEGAEPGYAPVQYTSFWEETTLTMESELQLSDEQLEDYLSEQEDLLFDNI